MFRLHIFHLVAWQECLLNMLCLRILDTRLNFIQNMPKTSKSNSGNKVLNQVSFYLEIKYFCFRALFLIGFKGANVSETRRPLFEIYQASLTWLIFFSILGCVLSPLHWSFPADDLSSHCSSAGPINPNFVSAKTQVIAFRWV